MNRLKKYLIPILLCNFTSYSGQINAKPEVIIDDSRNIITVSTNGESSLQTLKALSENLGFSITGSLENDQSTWTDKLKNKPEALIYQLVFPQSVAIIYKRDENGVKKISRIELIPTGNVDTKYMINAEDGAKPLTGTQDQIEKRIAHNERRARNRAKKIEEGTLIWSPEYQKNLDQKQNLEVTK